jgi:hypothetical protein
VVIGAIGARKFALEAWLSESDLDRSRRISWSRLGEVGTRRAPDQRAVLRPARPVLEHRQGARETLFMGTDRGSLWEDQMNDRVGEAERVVLARCRVRNSEQPD